MSDSARYPRSEVPLNRKGEVLTVVESTMRSRLDVAVGSVARPVHLDSLGAAITAVSARPVRAVLVGPAVIDGDVSPGLARLVRACAGSALVAVVASWAPGLPERLLAFGSHGIRDVVDVTRAEELGRLRIILDRPEWDVSRRLAEMILPHLTHATEEMRYFVSNLIQLAPTLSTTKSLAAHLGVRNNSMASRFFRARLPTPKEYLAAARLLYVAAALEVPHVSVAQAARRMNYSSPQSFARHVKEQLGVSAGEFRDEYSLELMVNYFINRLLFRHRTTLHRFEPFGRKNRVAGRDRDQDM